MARDERGGTPAFSRRRLLEIGGAASIATVVPGATALGAGRRARGSRATTINLVCEAGGKAELTKIVQLFRQQTGTTVNLVELPYAGLYNRIHSELSSGSLSFDVAALDVIWLPTFAGALQPVDDLFTAAVKADLFPSLVSGARIRGRYVGMPVWTNSEIVFYRRDLFASPANRKAFKARYGYALAAPRTWKQYDDVSRFFTRGTKLYGTDVKGAVETEWLAHVLQAGSPGVVLDSSGKVIVDNAQHLAALRFYSNLHNRYKVDPPGAAQTDWAAAQNLFNQGKLAVTRFWAHAFPQIPKNAPVYGKVGVAPMIGGAAGVAGIPGPWYLSVPAKARNAELATQFLKFSYDHNALAIQSSLGLAARKSAFAAYARKPGYQHFGALLTTLSARSTKGRPAHPKWQQIVDTVLVPMLQKSVGGGTVDYAGLLKSARSSTQRIVNS